MKKQPCQNNPNESYTERKAMHEPCGYSLDLVASFNSVQNKHKFYRGKDWIKMFFSDLKELGTKKNMKKEYDNDKTITYKLKFIDTCRFMRSKLSNLLDNLSEINNKDCKTCMERKNIKSECGFIGFKNNRLNYRCKECKRTSTKSINEIIEKFPRMYQFFNGHLNKFVLLLRKGAYPYG